MKIFKKLAERGKRSQHITLAACIFLAILVLVALIPPAAYAINPDEKGTVSSSLGASQPASQPASETAGSESSPLSGEIVQSGPSATILEAGEGAGVLPPPATEDEPTVHLVRFVPGTGTHFAGAETEITFSIENGLCLTAEQLPPVVLQNEGEEFAGWLLGDVLYSDEELLQLAITDSVTFTATAQKTEMLFSGAPYSAASIGGVINPDDADKICIVPGTDGSSYQAYSGTPEGLTQALLELYTNANMRDFTLYIGSNIFINATSDPSVTDYRYVAYKDVPTDPITAENVSFASLEGRVGTLTMVSSYTDPTDTTTQPPDDAKSLDLQGLTETYFGCEVIWRNIKIRMGSQNVFMKGHNITMDHGTYWMGTSLTLVAGTVGGESSGDLTLTVNSTGAPRSMYFYGGGAASSVHNGNTMVVINNTSDLAGTGVINVFGGATLGNAGGVTDPVNGVITGNSTAIINSVGANVRINNISGGGNLGDTYGNTYLEVNGTGDASIAGIYGGGLVLVASGTANVGGNVTTVINQVGGTIGTVYGGTRKGTVGGRITTTIRGSGGFTETSTYFGGSGTGLDGDGNVGGALPAGSDAIVNNLDLSAYSGWLTYVGGNAEGGTINGNIVNNVKAGDYGNGSISSFAGGNGPDTANPAGTNTDNITGFTADTAAIKAASAQVVNGDITSNLIQGCFGKDEATDYTSGAGYGGYVAGDVTLVLGSEGLVYAGDNAAADTTQSNTLNDRDKTSWAVAGGGGVAGNPDSIFIEGSTEVVVQNALVHTVYGGSFGGAMQGSSTAKMQGGLVDNCIGGGQQTQLHYGGTASAIVEDGQVDNILAGSWNDTSLAADTQVIVRGGTVNAMVAGAYGEDTSHLVNGNTSVTIYGGDLSGTPRSVEKSISGGLANAGTQTGNATLTFDLREQSTPVLLPDNVPIAAGRPLDAGPDITLGGSAGAVATLNVYADADTLNPALLAAQTLYGDGGLSHENFVGENIVFNIDAPGMEIGPLYATQYNQALAAGLQNNVTYNLLKAASIEAVHGGSAADDLTEAVMAASGDKKILINVGPDTTPDAALTIGSGGIHNFTALTVDGVDLVGTGTTRQGSFLNGSGATPANHNTSYYSFGALVLKNGARLQMDGSANENIISVSSFTIQGDAGLHTPSGSGRLNLTSYSAQEDGMLTWVRTGGADMIPSVGTKYGARDAYQVLTFTTHANAAAVHDLNFKGISGSNSYFGDSDMDLREGRDPYSYGIAILDESKGFQFYKVDAFNNTTPLPGAEFALYQCVNQDAGHQHYELVTEETLGKGCWAAVTNGEGEPLVATSVEDGLVNFGPLEDGVYMLVETKAPAGYELPTGQWMVEIDSIKPGLEGISIVAKGEMLPPAFVDASTETESRLLLQNQKPFDLPMSGSVGTGPFITTGILLLGGGMATFLYKRKPRVKKFGRRYLDGGGKA